MTPQEKKYDILFFGAPSCRRKNIVYKLTKKFKIYLTNHVYGKELTKLINQSKILLNLHFYDKGILETVILQEGIYLKTHIISEYPCEEDMEAVEPYKDRVEFVEVIKDDLSNIHLLEEKIEELLKGEKEVPVWENKIVNNLDLLCYPHLFHKYILGLSTADDPIKYEIVQQEDVSGNYFAHLHCYDISKFDEIYGEYIKTIGTYFNIVITYSIGEKKIDKYTVLKIPNRGWDIGAKFCMVQYLKGQNEDYSHILFLHSKTDVETRKKYFGPLISSIKENEFIENINDYDGYFPDIQWEIQSDRLKMISGNPQFVNSNLPERNLLYRNELLKYLGCKNKTNRFVEGNVYILSKKIVEKIFGEKKLYNILNRSQDFDYNWMCKRYKLCGNIQEVYNEFVTKKLSPRDDLYYDGYIEHAFERVVLNLCDKYKIFKKLNLIGLTNINCSISDNLYLLKKYFENNKKYVVNIFDINNLKNINYNASETIFCLQPFELKHLLPQLRKFKIRPSVLWVWEFKSLPRIFKKYEKYFSKVYVPSQFCYDVFTNHLSIPIEKINLKSQIHDYLDKIPNYKIINQNVNNILEKIKNKTKYGFCFDLNSSIVRKNPLNLVKAFNSLNDESKVLVLKYRLPRSNHFVNKIEKDIYDSFIIEVNKNNNIYRITEELESLDLYKLYTNFDYYISPHCGEGFGFTIYDNMILGNKIITPYYSGETEYLKRENIIELEYEEKEIQGLREHPVYGQMKDFKGAYVSESNILNILKNGNIDFHQSKQSANHKNIFLIDCQPMQHEIRGIGMYGVNLVNVLLKNYSDIFSFHLIINNILNDKLINRIITQEKTIIHKVNFKNVNKNEYEKFLANYINNLKPKIFLNLSEFDWKKVAANIDLLDNNIKTFSILHDLIPLKNGWLKKMPYRNRKRYQRAVDNLKKYDKLLSNSEFTKKDCCDVFNNIEYLGTGVNDYTKTFTKEYQQCVLKKYNIKKKYIYCQTSYGRNKGIAFLYQQYLKLSDNIKKDLLLVFGGKFTSRVSNNIKNKNVIVTGYLLEEDLHILHENAWLFIFPSTYEGFGIPPVEAMKHNKPVIVANNTSLVEVIDNDKFMFNHDEKSCSDLITKLYYDQNLYNECIKNSIRRKNVFDWEDVCNKLFNIVSFY